MVDPNPALLGLGALVLVGALERRIERRAGTDQRPIIRLEGCSGREAAEALRGCELLVARSQAPQLGPDEWWAEDLVGCAVRDGERRVGIVARLLALPSCEVLEVAREPGGERADDAARGDEQTLLVPLVADAVRQVDLGRRAIDVDLRFLGEE